MVIDWGGGMGGADRHCVNPQLHLSMSASAIFIINIHHADVLLRFKTSRPFWNASDVFVFKLTIWKSPLLVFHWIFFFINLFSWFLFFLGLKSDKLCRIWSFVDKSDCYFDISLSPVTLCVAPRGDNWKLIHMLLTFRFPVLITKRDGDSSSTVCFSSQKHSEVKVCGGKKKHYLPIRLMMLPCKQQLTRAHMMLIGEWK